MQASHLTFLPNDHSHMTAQVAVWSWLYFLHQASHLSLLTSFLWPPSQWIFIICTEILICWIASMLWGATGSLCKIQGQWKNSCLELSRETAREKVFRLCSFLSMVSQLLDNLTSLSLTLVFWRNMFLLFLNEITYCSLTALKYTLAFEN